MFSTDVVEVYQSSFVRRRYLFHKMLWNREIANISQSITRIVPVPGHSLQTACHVIQIPRQIAHSSELITRDKCPPIIINYDVILYK